MRRFEFVDSKSNKFWETKTEGPKLMVRFGRIGGTWQESDKLLADAEKANAEMEKLIREKTRKGYLEVGGKPEVKVLAKVAPKKAKTKEPKPQSMEATISPAERKAKAQKVLLMFANGQWDLAHNILENAQDEEWLFEQLLNGCKIENGKPIPSNAIKKAIKEDEKSNQVLAMLNIMLCIPHGSKLLKTFKFKKLTGSLDLGQLKILNDSAAESLSKHKGDLSLHHLESLSDSFGHVALAKKLAHQKGVLYLSSLKSLSDAAAEVLSNHKGGLNLYGLTSLSDSAAEALSKQKGWLNLVSLTSLSDAAAEALSSHEGDMYLNSLKSLSDAAVVALSKRKGDLDLCGLTNLSDAAVEALSKHKGVLALDGLKSLSDAAAEVLSKHKGDLDLCGLTNLSDAAVEALSKHKGVLALDGLKSLSDAAAEVLCKHKGDLSFNGLESLSDSPEHIALAKKLARQKDELWLNDLTSLTAAAAKALSKHEGELKLRGSLKRKVEKYKNQGDKK